MIPIFMAFDKSLQNNVFHVLDSIIANTDRDIQAHFIVDESVDARLIKQWDDMGVAVHVVEPPVKSFYRTGMVRSPAMFYRWLIPQFCTDKAVYLDNDVIVTGDIAEMYDIELGDNLIAAVPDRFAQVIAHTTPHQLGKWHSGKEFGIDFESRSYMSGQLLINCAMWRSWALTEKMCDFVENTGALDMLTLNVFCAGRVHELGREWCISANYDEVPSNARLLHWHGTAKPWAEKCKNQKYYDIYAGGVQ